MIIDDVPTHFTNNHAVSMTLPDYFAAKAMQGFLSISAHKGIYAPPDNELASAAYDLADAMLEARNAAQ